MSQLLTLALFLFFFHYVLWPEVSQSFLLLKVAYRVEPKEILLCVRILRISLSLSLSLSLSFFFFVCVFAFLFKRSTAVCAYNIFRYRDRQAHTSIQP